MSNIKKNKHQDTSENILVFLLVLSTGIREWHNRSIFLLFICFSLTPLCNTAHNSITGMFNTILKNQRPIFSNFLLPADAILYFQCFHLPLVYHEENTNMIYWVNSQLLVLLSMSLLCILQHHATNWHCP